MLILVPLGIAFILSFRFIETDTTNEWIGFWGGYLGAIIGGIITLAVMQKTLKSEHDNRNREEKIVYFNQITNLISKLVQATHELDLYMARRRYEKENDITENIFKENAILTSIITELQIMLETRSGVYEVKDILTMLKNFENKTTEILNCFYEVAEDEFKNEKMNKKFEEKQDDLQKELGLIQNCMKKTIMENVF